ncbi:MAG: SDR family NAD(P)-dependent oxidoreductase [Bacilli bacterium]|nr:SDR family NAD(P)-dependent oxidoreductase [Bacilli bacterium]
MSSMAGIIPIPFLGSYCSTKASIIKLSECLKKELKILNSNIKICLIEPGMYKTGFNKVMFDNKYNTNFDLLFKEELELIRKKENIMMFFLEKKKLNSIVKQIIKAIETDKKFIYRSPILQSIGVKIYNILN